MPWYRKTIPITAVASLPRLGRLAKRFKYPVKPAGSIKIVVAKKNEIKIMIPERGLTDCSRA
jgi:hypothetical protein